MNVLTAAWLGTGAPTTGTNADEGPCARCGLAGELVPTRSVISKSFTSFDGWSDPAGPGLCPACTWGHSSAALRSVPHLVTREPTALRKLTKQEAGTLLRAGDLGPGRALVVPLRPGRKHVLPTAIWGRVSIDDIHLPWRAQDAELLTLILELRADGFGTRMLSEPAPPFRVLQAIPSVKWQRILHIWDQLAPWRAPDNPWLPLALHLTTPTATKESS